MMLSQLSFVFVVTVALFVPAQTQQQQDSVPDGGTIAQKNSADQADQTGGVIRLPGAAGSGPFEAVKDWISAFESRFPEADFTVSSVGSGAAQSALWGDVDCAKKPVEGICPANADEEQDGGGQTQAIESMLTSKTVWGIGGGTFDASAYETHAVRGLQQLPALGGPILVTYSKDVTGDLGSRTSSTQLNLSLETVAGIFNNTITRWDHPSIVAENPSLDMPSERITVLVRSDKSGMSQTFTEAIKHAVPSWPDDGVGKTPEWPLANLTLSSSASAATTCVDLDVLQNEDPSAVPSLNFKADGQTGIGIGLLRRPFSIGYLELGYYSTLTQFVSQAYVSSPNLPTDYEAATPATIRTTMDGLVDELEPETLSVTMVDNPTPLGGFSISRYVYWYIKTAAEEYESCDQAWLLYQFLVWTFTDPLAEEIALSHGWVTIPTSVANKALEKLNQIQCIDVEDKNTADGGKAIYVSTYTPLAYREEQPTNDEASAKVIIPAIVVPLLSIAAILAYVYVERKKRSMDTVWSVKPDELKFDEPPETVGRGTFGLVLLAEYRGTQVAVKRVIPPRMQFQSSNREGNRSTGSHKKGLESGGSVNFRRTILGTGDAIDDESAEPDGLLSGDSSTFISLTRRLSMEASVSTDAKRSCKDIASAAGRRASTGTQSNSSTGRRRSSVNSTTAAGRRSSDQQYSSNGGRRSSTQRLSVKFDFPDSDLDESSIDESNAPHDDVEMGAQPQDRNGDPPGECSPYRRTNGVDSSRKSGSRSIVRKKSSTLQSVAGRLRLGKSDDYEKLKKDFVQEMRHLSTLRHPCITTVMGAVIENGVEPMLVMEYMSHGSLYDILHNGTVPIDGDMLFSCMLDVAQGLRFLHCALPQIIHGDLKAQNILVDSKFRYKVADFGLSQKKAMVKNKSAAITGTPFWMAPELLREEASENTAASDVYSFGIILYEIYSRRDPYEGENVFAVLRDVCDSKIKKRPPVPPGCPPAVAGIMKECLLNDPSARPTFEELDLRLNRLNVKSVEPANNAQNATWRKTSQDIDPTQSNEDSLLYKLFPRHIADALREGRKVEPEHHECVTVFFSDVVGFTNISWEIGPRKCTHMLERLYNRFDELAVQHDVFNIETIGDAYIAVANLVKDQKKDHVKRIAEFARDAVTAAGEVLIDEDRPSRGTIDVRIGFHTGPVISDVLGTQQPKYSIFGDTMNTASRMESTSLPGAIQCSMTSAYLLMEQAPGIPQRSRGPIRVKGRGEMHTFWVFEKSE